MSASGTVDGVMLLCDFAQEVGGKLYILGAGWSRMITFGQPLNMALAVKLSVPWHAANNRLQLEIKLVTEDGRPVPNAMTGDPIKIEGQFEVGRPPGLTPGTPLDTAMAIPILGMPLQLGTYRWELAVDGELVQTVRFEVITPPPGFPVPPSPPPAPR